jgi:hypothetical protein
VLNVAVPRLLIPVIGDEPVVAPVIIQVSFVTVQLSPVVGFGEAMEAEHKPLLTLAVWFDGHVIVGFSLSVIVIENVQEAVKPEPSVAVYVMVVVPILNVVVPI